jgi:hypothetical protein
MAWRCTHGGLAVNQRDVEISAVDPDADEVGGFS